MASKYSGTESSSAARQSEPDTLTWYSRFAVWVGALVLLLQSVTGRGPGVLTVLAVISLTAGFALFLAGLSWGGRQDRRTGARPVRRPDSRILQTAAQSSDGREQHGTADREGELEAVQPAVLAERDTAAEREA